MKQTRNAVLTGVLCAFAYLLAGCAGSSQQSAAQRILGRWKITDWQLPNLPPEDTAMQRMMRTAGAGPDGFGYMEFLPDGHLRMSVMGQTETITYETAGDTLIIFNRAAEPNEPMLVSFEAPEGAILSTLKHEQVYTLRGAPKP